MHDHMSSLLSDDNLRRLSPAIGELAERMADEAERRIRDRRHLDLVVLFQALMVDCVAQCVFRYDAKPFRIDKP